MAVSCVSAAFGSLLAVLSLFLLSTLTSLAGAVIELGCTGYVKSGGESVTGDAVTPNDRRRFSLNSRRWRRHLSLSW